MTILVLAQDAGGIPKALSKGFEALGAQSELFVYSDGVAANGILDRVVHRFVDPGYQTDMMFHFNRTINGLEERIFSRCYDAIVVMRGNYLSRRNRELLEKAGFPIVLWTYDSLCRAPMQRDVMAIADHVFFVDREDVGTAGVARNEWLPLGYDDEIYFPSEEKDFDIFMSGSIGPLYTRRRHFLEILGASELSRKYHVKFIGTTGFRLKDLLIRTGRVEWVSKRVSPEMLARFQARARVCVNIHQDDGKFSVNPSFFSIPGSGTCQLAEDKKHLGEFLEPGKEFQEFRDEDFIQVLKSLLEDHARRKEIAEKGLSKVKSRHNMLARAKKLLEIITRLR